jgi:DNA-binding NtrC family response regulator
LGEVKEHVRVVETDSAEKALEMFKARKFDYVIADIDLGKMRLNGYEFSQMILEKYPSTHVLIHSNKRKAEMDKDIREIKSNRFMGFLPKPMKADELLQFLACKTFEVPTDGRAIEPAKRKTVLIVNDDDAMSLAFKIMLRSPGIQVLTATSVSAAINILSEQKVDMILSDINLGDNEPDGYELLRQVRANNNGIPFNFMSGYNKADHWPRARELGATGYLQLPVDGETIKKLLGVV